jgi:Skp family chaperone for outer membrane proteins
LPSTLTRVPARTLAVLLALTLAFSLSSPSHADDPAELRREVSQVEKRAAELATRTVEVENELEKTRAELAELERKLKEVTARLLAAQEREARALEDAELARGQAEHALRELEAGEDALSDNADQLGDLARDTYKYGAPRSSVVSLMGTVTGESGPGEISDAVQYLNRGIGSWSVLVEESEALVVRVDAAAVRAEEERQRQEALLAEAEAAREEVAVAHADAQDLVSEASLKEERQKQLVAELAEAQAAAKQQIRDLNSRIEAEERRRAEEARRRAEAEARRKAQEEARRQAAAEAEARRKAEAEAAAKRRSAAQPARSTSSSSSSSGSSAPATRIVNSAPGLVTVGGITVASSLGPNLKALLDAARADGIVLGGHGYRSTESQIRLRQVNGCPDVYNSPASACRVPTAKPGSSEHEKGLAVDFTYNGQTICFPNPGSRCSGNPGFNWLKANAHKYGLRNLATEAWHWSTTGR